VSIYVVTGANGGIGSAVVRSLLARNKTVVGVARRHDKGDEQSTNTGYFPVSIRDINDEQEVQNFLATLPLLHTNIHRIALIHTVGVLHREADFLSTEMNVWHDSIETNLTGSYLWNRSLIRYMVANKISGSIVNIGSQASKTGGFGPNIAYAASKGGLVSMSKSFARHSAKYGIQVNVVIPGFVDNPMMMTGLNESEIASFKDRIPLGRFASNEEIARVCVNLVDPSNSYQTGAVIDLSGGFLDV
jgi:3-oxoacyl-[acyl-carrier protein] reductase